MDYLIDTPNRRKQKRVCHVNLLKLYKRRDEKQFPNSADAVTVNFATVDVGVSIPALSDLKTSTPTHTENEYLTQLQQTELDELLANYADIFSYTPGKTSLSTHHIALVSDTKPISLSPYRLHPEKAELVQNEIDEMLRMDIITHSDSPWASPIVIVPKPDGSIRLCVDYRRVNSLTVPDPFPLLCVEVLVDKLGQANYLTKVDMINHGIISLLWC